MFSFHQQMKILTTFELNLQVFYLLEKIGFNRDTEGILVWAIHVIAPSEAWDSACDWLLIDLPLICLWWPGISVLYTKPSESKVTEPAIHQTSSWRRLCNIMDASQFPSCFPEMLIEWSTLNVFQGIAQGHIQSFSWANNISLQSTTY